MDLKKDLNNAQVKAVQQLEGPCLIVAGAGSGKTRVLTYKIAHLIESGVNPHEVLALTFTNKAANEMKQRIFSLVGENAASILMGTFHSIFARILRWESTHIGFDRNFSIYDDQDSKKVIENIMKAHNWISENSKPEVIYSIIKSLKNKLVLPDDFYNQANNPIEITASKVYEEYQKILTKNNAMDFDDLLINPIILFKNNSDVLQKYQRRFKFVLVDEYQDTNVAQYQIIKMLSDLHKNITVVGDDAQSIYRWRGAEIENILRFETDFSNCNVFKLEQNYRSTQNILALADEIIKNNKRQIPKTLFTKNDAGEQVILSETLSDKDEAAYMIKSIMNECHNLKLNFKDFVILYRTNAQSRIIEEAFRKNSIPYIIVGGIKFYQRKEIKDVIAYLKVLVNSRDDESMSRILALREGIGDITIERLSKYAQENKMTLSNALHDIFIRKETASEKQTRINAELLKLANLLENYRQIKNELTPGELAGSLVDELGIVRKFRNEGTEEALDRMNNVMELLNAISEYTDYAEKPTLEGFLQEVSLVTDIDSYDDKKNAVTLMTIHSAKGLEFPVVFISGLEEGLFPLMSSYDSLEEMEEERRLFYVAATRAMSKLYMTYALTRYRFGAMSYQMKSRFLSEIKSSLYSFHKLTAVKTNYQRTVEVEGTSIRYEYYNDGSANDDEDVVFQNNGIKKGSIVYHNNFGKGKVLELTGKGDQKKAQIKFDKVGVKNIILKYANLQIK